MGGVPESYTLKKVPLGKDRYHHLVNGFGTRYLWCMARQARKRPGTEYGEKRQR